MRDFICDNSFCGNSLRNFPGIQLEISVEGKDGFYGVDRLHICGQCLKNGDIPETRILEVAQELLK